uniref:Uncharacterized protein n=1 Tax=Strongyloides stercoralis TaxID=6248 RepID=A0A0K0ELU1_STRER
MNYLIIFFCVLKVFVYSRNIYYQQRTYHSKEQYYKYPTYYNYNNQNYYRQQQYYQHRYTYQNIYPMINQQYNNNYYNPTLSNTKGLNFKEGFVPFYQMKIGEAYGNDLAQYWIICHTCPKGK